MAIGTAAMSPHRPSEGDPRQAQAQVLGDDDWLLSRLSCSGLLCSAGNLAWPEALSLGRALN